MTLYIDYPSWIDPYVVSFLPVRWYAVMYLVAFFITYLLFRYQVSHDKVVKMTGDQIEGLFFCCIIGLFLGARIFSCIFYSDTVYYLTHPWMMFWPFENGKFTGLPGMSYHGGAVGCFLGGWIYARKNKRSILLFTDMMCAGIPLGYTFGRLGNFINGELYGRVTSSSIGMVFPLAERFSTTHAWVREIADSIGMSYSYGEMLNLPRHPAQLYEALFEGIFLFLFLWFLIRPLKYKKGWKDGVVFAFYLIGYGLVRFIIEYFREPDAYPGYVIKWGEGSGNIAVFTSFLNISRGQVFCFLMILGGLALLLFLKLGRNDYEGNKPKSGKSEKNPKAKRV